MDAKNIFFILASVLVILVIIQFASNLYSQDNTSEENPEATQIVYVPGGYIPWGRPFWRRPFWNRPIVGPRPGGYYVGPYSRRYRLGRRRR